MASKSAFGSRFKLHECWVVRSMLNGKLKVKKSAKKTQEDAAKFYAESFKGNYRKHKGEMQVQFPRQGSEEWHPVAVSEWSPNDDSGSSSGVDSGTAGEGAGSGSGGDP